MNDMLRRSHELPLLVVVYDLGAAWPSDIANACLGIAEPLFLVPDSEHTASVRLVLESIGTVVDVDDEDLMTIIADANGVVTFCEELLPLATDLADRLGLRGHDQEVLERLTDKVHQRECLPADLSPGWAPWVGDPLTAAEEVGYPLVLKPRRSSASADTYRVEDAAALEAVAALVPSKESGYILERELVGVPSDGVGDYVSVESVVDEGHVSHVQITGKYDLLPPYREPGQFWPAQLSDGVRREVLDATTRALDAIGVKVGVTHTELKLTPAGPRIIEVNGRMGGNMNELSRRALDLDLVRFAIQLAMGEHPTVPNTAPSAVSFQVNTLAPVVGCTFENVEGAAAVRSLPGIDSYTVLVNRGESLPASVATRVLDLLCGQADTHEAMLALISQAHRELTFHFGGVTPRSVSATELMTGSESCVAIGGDA